MSDSPLRGPEPPPALAEADVRARIDFLEQANEAWSDFIRTASRELRTPLEQVRGFAGLLAAPGSALDDEGQRLVATIVRAGDRLRRLTGDLLELSEIDAMPLRPVAVDLGELVGDLVRERRASAAGQRVGWSVGELPVVRGDPALLRIAIGRLLDNAVKYSAPRDAPAVTCDATRVDGAWRLRLRDNGVGFDPRYAGRLFQPLQRLHPASRFGGSGIGLALVRRIVLRHGGQVGADSSSDQGATFWIELPD